MRQAICVIMPYWCTMPCLPCLPPLMPLFYFVCAPSPRIRIAPICSRQATLKKCTHLPALEPLLKEAPVNIQKYVLEQFAKTLPHDQDARRTFVQSGGLQLVQQLKEQFGGKLTEHIQTINDCYPPEIVEYYSPEYADTLMKKLDEFTPV